MFTDQVLADDHFPLKSVNILLKCHSKFLTVSEYNADCDVLRLYKDWRRGTAFDTFAKGRHDLTART